MKGYDRVPMGVSGGLNKDLPSHDLDPNTYSEMHNLRMKDTRLVPAQGYTSVLETVPVAPEHILGVVKSGAPAVYVAGETSLRQYASGAWSDVSRLVGGVYSGAGKWQSTVLNGCIFMNNGIDTLQVMEPADSDFKNSVNIPASFTAQVFRSFKNHLFALRVNEGVSESPTTLRWSDPSDAGNEPPSWDVTDPTTQSGQLSLADTDGGLIDAMQLRDNLIIYKSDAVYSCNYIGGVFVFSFQKILNDRGALAEGCVSEFEGQHFVVGYNDIYIHDGLKAKSISEGRVRDYFYSDLDQDNLDNVFTTKLPEYKEIWICYPTTSATNGACNKALVWNWQYNVWSTRDLPNISDSATAIIDPSIVAGDAWDAGADVTWDAGDGYWDIGEYTPAQLYTVLSSKEDDKIYQVDDTLLFGGEDFTFTLERESFHFGDDTSNKYLNHLTPNVSGYGTLAISVGTQPSLGTAISWKAPANFTIGNFRFYARGQGRYMSFRVQGATINTDMSLLSLDPHVNGQGEK